MFPAESLTQALQQDVSTTASFLIRLRVVHPVIAVATGFYLIVIAGLPSVVGSRTDAKRSGRVLIALFIVQLAAGVANVLLLAPVWMQMVHLLLADLTWIALVLLTASALAEERAAVSVDGALRSASEGLAWTDVSTSAPPPGG